MTFFRLISLFVLSFFIGQSNLFAQNIKFEHIADKHGLPQNVITSIYQDSFGFMWFGTQNGLARYDGYEFKVFQNKKGDSTSISNNLIQGITQDSSGKLWIGTLGGGLNVYDYITGDFHSYRKGEKGLTSDDILCLEVDQKGSLWIGTSHGGICYLDSTGNSFGSIRVQDNQDLNSVNALLFSDDIVYAGGDKAYLFKIDREYLTVKPFVYEALKKKASLKRIVKGITQIKINNKKEKLSVFSSVRFPVPNFYIISSVRLKLI